MKQHPRDSSKLSEHRSVGKKESAPLSVKLAEPQRNEQELGALERPFKSIWLPSIGREAWQKEYEYFEELT